nr:ribonuclease H-like domain-containing protein [Tanacetum cinerariifolium]
MTNYLLWEVILNGDSPAPTRVIEGVVQPVAPTTTEQRLARKNELKARGTLLMALPDKHQLKFNIHKDAKTLMEAIEKRFGGNKETKKVQKTILNQSNSPQFDNDDLKQIDNDDLEEMDLKWQMAMLTVRARYHSGDGYHAVSPPYTGTFMPPKLDLVFHDAPNVNETVHTAFNVKLSPTKPDKALSHTHRPSTHIIEDWISDSEDDSEPEIPQNAPTATHKTAIPKPKSQGNSRNKKECFVCKSLTHLIKDCDFYEKKMAKTPARNHAERGNHQHYANMTLPNPQRHMVTTAVLTKFKLVPITATRPVTAAVPKPHVTSPKPAKTIVTKPHSPPRRPINRSSSPKAFNFPPKVIVVKVSQVNAVKDVQGKWEWKPKCPILDHVSRHRSASMTLKRFYYNDALGRSKTGKLDFNDVYFVKELKFNLFSVSKMCDKKNNVLFIDTECLVLSPEFKLPDANQVLLRVPRKNNTYKVDLKNIVLFGDLTFLFVKATLDESNLWHRRLDHINFKTMNKLDERIKREFSVPRTPQQNGIAERKNKTLIEASRTMLADSILPIPFWAEAVNTACYVKNNVLVTKPKNKTPYELLLGRTYSIVVKPLEYSTVEPELYKRPSATQTRSMTRVAKDQEEPKRVHQALKDPSWIEAIQEELIQFKMQKEEGIDYEEVFAPVVYVCQPRGFEDPDYPKKVYKVVKALYGLHQAPRAWYESLANYLLENGFQRGKIDQTLFIKRQKDGKSASTPIDTKKPLLKDLDGEDVDVHTYRSMIGSLMYLTSSRPDIMNEAATPSSNPEITHVSSILVGILPLSHSSPSYLRTAISNYEVFLDMPALEDITYSDDEEDVSAEAGFSNLETNISVNDVTRLQALVDKKKVIITEATIRDALQLDDAKSIDCLPNEEIFTELSRMGAKRTSWNEFSSSMALAVICLSTSRKFNFYKYIFDSLMRNVDSSTKFYMYPRFLQLMIRAQVGDLFSHFTKYSSPALTQKVFANMRRVGKGISGVDIPLFEGMIVAQQADEGATKVNVDDVPTADVDDKGASSVAVDDVPTAVDEPSIPSPPPTTQPPPPSQDLPSTSQLQPTPPPSLISQPPSPQQQPQSLQDAKILMDLLHTLLETCTTLTRRVEHLEQDKIAQSLEIIKLKQRVKKLERRNKLKGRIIASMDADEDVTLKYVAEVAKDVDDVVKDVEIEESVLSMQDDELEPPELQEVVEVVTTAKLMTEVVTVVSATITAADTPIPTAIIPSATLTLTTAPSAARKRKRVVIRDLEETATPSTIIHTEPKSKDKGKGILVEEPKPLKKQAQIEQDEAFARELEAELNKIINWDDVIDQLQRKDKKDNAMMRYQALKKKPQTKAQARKNMMIYLRNMAGFKMDYFKGMKYDDIRLIFEKYFNLNVAFLEKTKEQIEEEDYRALKRANESQAEKAAKRQKLDE